MSNDLMNTLLRYFGYSVKRQSMVLFPLTYKLEYRSYVKKGISMGRRPELVGGGLIRRLGWWDESKGAEKPDPRGRSPFTDYGKNKIGVGSPRTVETMRTSDFVPTHYPLTIDAWYFRW